MSKIATGLLIFVVLALVALGGYLVYQNQVLTKKLIGQSPQPSSSQEPNSSQTPQESPVPTAKTTYTKNQTENAIKTNVNSKNFVGLIPYATKPTVNFIIMSSECCEPQTPEELVSQLSYIDEGVPMGFNQDSDLVKNLKSKNSQLSTTFIGIAQNGEHLAAFTINQDGFISQIQVAVTWKLYSY